MAASLALRLISVQGKSGFLSIIPWMSILSYFLEVPDIKESHLYKGQYVKKQLFNLSVFSIPNH
ncbi:MAG: hypothetical protein WBM86_17500 [Waterburya sp.]